MNRTEVSSESEDQSEGQSSEENSTDEKSSSDSDSTSDSSSSEEESRRKCRCKRKSKKHSRRQVKKRRKTRSKTRSTRKKGRKRSRSDRSKSRSVSGSVDTLIANALEKQRLEMEQYLKQIQEQHTQQVKDLEGATAVTPKRGNKICTIIKSPSESAIYEPAVKRGQLSTVEHVLNQNNIDNDSQLDNFIQEMRDNLTVSGQKKDSLDSNTDNQNDKLQINERNDEAKRSKETKNAAEIAVIQAEKFKVRIENPKGRCQNFIDTLDATHKEVNDDDYTHVSCHVDDPLMIQCKRGDFVELLKLKPKSKTQMNESESHRLDIITKDGHSYLVSGNKETQGKINSVRQWEQCFRVYAAIYSEANPTRASEIWQYVEIINQAASTFTWENVALYDFHFRKHMAKYPGRSWAKIHNQMWNLDLKEHLPIIRNNNNNNVKFGPSAKGSNICWRSNKGHCKFGEKCRYEHKCAYCGIPGHNAINCRKKGNKQSGQQSDKVDKPKQKSNAESS